ncbi:hypothetical protein P3L10_010628 [Capsicum annuum]
MIEAYLDKRDNLFDVEYVEGIAQQPSGSLDCGLFVVVYVEYLRDHLELSNDGLNVELLIKYMLLFNENSEKQKLKNHMQAILKIHDY